MSDVLSTTQSPSGPARRWRRIGRAPQRDGRRPRRGRALRALSTLLIVLGALVLIDGAVTLVWQEPLSALYAKFEQDHLRGTLRTIERAQPSAAERAALARLSEERRIAFLAQRLQRHAAPGSPIGTIRVPRIGANFVVIDGTGVGELEKGPGIYPDTHFPGLGSTTAIAGHRTTWLAPFRRINELRPGDRIVLDMPYAHFLYTVTGQRVVDPTNVRAAVATVSYSRLVLSACTPLFSAAKRILVYARLTSAVPVGAAVRS
ncbi:MAG TPA: class E sortase [Solirubrobacteraceae bacterium]|nr:class E sortase [Solirubrobacteraceae bacterium]